MGRLAYFTVLGLAAIAGLFLVSKAEDALFEFHAWVFVAACALAMLYQLKAIDYSGTKPVVQEKYFDGVVRAGVIATVFWGLTGFLVGVVIAAQLSFPDLNFDTSYTNFGRLRPLHTSAVVFAFVGNALMCTSFYTVQRTCATRLAFGNLAWFVFWGYQLFIVLAATGYLLGATQSREYAEPEWYVDIWLTVVWVCYLAVFLGTLWKRKEPHIYVGNWFYLAFIVTIAM